MAGERLLLLGGGIRVLLVRADKIPENAQRMAGEAIPALVLPRSQLGAARARAAASHIVVDKGRALFRIVGKRLVDGF